MVVASGKSGKSVCCKLACGLLSMTSAAAGSAVLAEELFGALGYGQQAYDALLLADDAVGPGVEVNAHGLGEAAHHVEGKGKSRARDLGDGFFVGLVVLFPCVYRRRTLILCNRGGALERPQEERG